MLRNAKTDFLRCIGYLSFTKKTFKARFIANSSSCTTTELSILLTSCLTAVKNHVIRYCEKVYERSDKNLFWSIKKSGEILNKLKSRGFRATSLSTYDFSTLYTSLPHNLIKEKLINLIEWTFKREGSPYIACNERQAFFTSEDTKRYKLFLSESEFCGDLVYGFGKIMGGAGFSDRFGKIIVRYRRVGYSIGVVRRSACLVFGPVTVGDFASLFGCAPVGRASGSVVAPTWSYLF